jgi:hypothetical protein
MLEPGRVFALLTMLAICGVTLWNIRAALTGKQFRIRDMPGVRAIEEMVGRATEMGRPVHVSTGVGSLTGSSAPETFAGLQVLSHVARLCARYDARLIATACQPDVFVATIETARQSYVEEGKGDKFKETDMRYLSTDQWAYAAGIVGIVARENVSANILIGGFAAETMLLAEASYQAGAAQIAGTTNMYQLPFFVAACDYTLIGEEMFAVGAFLTKDGVQLGSLAGQDFGKAVGVGLILLGIISASFKLAWLQNLMKM